MAGPCCSSLWLFFCVGAASSDEEGKRPGEEMKRNERRKESGNNDLEECKNNKKLVTRGERERGGIEAKRRTEDEKQTRFQTIHLTEPRKTKQDQTKNYV